MKRFMDEDFLLDTPAARELYHEGVEALPILDYHCHLSPREIYENRTPGGIAELWFSGDHYKWRALRSFGFPERLATGTPGKETFLAFAKVLENAPGNPLYHWAHLELQQYFDIHEPLCAASAERIYDKANERIHSGDFRPQSLIAASRVAALCTTDDPADDLFYHEKLREGGCAFRVLPTFRPDRALQVAKPDFPEYIAVLGQAAGMEICDFSSLKAALLRRMEAFQAVGCRVSDQSFSSVPFAPVDEAQANRIFCRALQGDAVTAEEERQYETMLMLFLGRAYADRGWVMELHMGAMRNNNARMFQRLGADTGFDSIGDEPVAHHLSRFLDALDREERLPKTVLFNLNPKDTLPLAAMLGNFQGEGIRGKLQYGPAWWFLDTMEGMENQLKALAQLGVLGTFIGMETDSRSFTSYPRHAYFRRILCRLLGRWAEEGWFDPDMGRLTALARGIAYENAAAYFNF